MRTIDMHLYQGQFNLPIVLGRKGEANTTKLCYNFSEIVEEYGEGTIEFVYKNPDLIQYVPADTAYDTETHIASWKPDLADTGITGEGHCEVRFYLEGDEGIYKTFMFKTVVLEALGETTNAPDPYDDIIHKMQEIKAIVTELKDEVIIAKEEAVLAADRAHELASKLMYSRMQKLRPYLYEVWYDLLDYNFANEYFESKFPAIAVPGCSVARKGNFVGSKFDWLYNEDAQFVVHSSHKDGRYETVGVTGSITGMTDAFVQMHKYSDLYRVAPFMVEACMNECGVITKTNVVPDEKGDNRVIEPEEHLPDRDFDIMCTLMLPRFIADNFESASAAIEYITTNVRMFHPQGLLDMGYNQHFMIADKAETYVLEFVDGHYVVIEEMERPILTNFHVDGIVLNDDGSVYTPQTKDEDHNAIRTNLISQHGSGLERFNLINESYEGLEDEEDWETLCDLLNYTRAYLTNDFASNPYWYTEFVGNNLNVASDTRDFNEVTIAAAQKFTARSRDQQNANYGTWQSSHTLLCNLDELTMKVQAQEDTSKWFVIKIGRDTCNES